MCSVPECERSIYARGWCNLHYSRWRRTGTTDDGRPDLRMSAMERFMAKVTKTPGCWIWTGATAPQGHGVFRLSNRRVTAPAHKWLWEQTRGPVPEGMVLDHIVCDNPPCVNPAHLKVSTIGANVLRGQSESAKNARKTHCPQNHELSGENLGIVVRHTRGGRIERFCRKCKRAREAVAVPHPRPPRVSGEKDDG